MNIIIISDAAGTRARARQLANGFNINLNNINAVPQRRPHNKSFVCLAGTMGCASAAKATPNVSVNS